MRQCDLFFRTRIERIEPILVGWRGHAAKGRVGGQVTFEKKCLERGFFCEKNDIFFILPLKNLFLKTNDYLCSEFE